MNRLCFLSWSERAASLNEAILNPADMKFINFNEGAVKNAVLDPRSLRSP